jgi:hypothetical protein
VTGPSRGQGTGAGVLAALLPVLAVPVGVGASAARLSGEGRLDGTLMLDWQDRPLAFTALGALAALVAVVCAVSLYLCSQRGSLAVLGLPAACSLLVVVGAVLRAQVPAATLAALSSAQPHELVPVLGGLWREGAHLLEFARTLAAALLVACALGCALVATTRAERLPWLQAPLLALFAMVLGLLGVREVALADALDEGARASAERVLAVAVEQSALAPDPRGALAVTSLGLALCLVVGVVALRSNPRAAALFVLLGLTGLAGPGGQVVGAALVKRHLATALRSPPMALVPLGGVLADAPVVVLAETGVVAPGGDAPLDEVALRALVADVQATRPHLLSRFPTGLGRGARPADLVKVAAEVARLGPTGGVHLVGLHHVDVSAGARELAWLFAPLQDSYRGVLLPLRRPVAGPSTALVPTRFDSVEALVEAAVAGSREAAAPFLAIE